MNLIMRAKKIVNQSSDFPVRRTGSYRHKKALPVTRFVVGICVVFLLADCGSVLGFVCFLYVFLLFRA